MSDDQDQNETLSQTSSHTLEHCHSEDDTSSEASSIPSTLLSRPASPEHEPMTVDKILQQIRQLEVEEHVKEEEDQTLSDLMLTQLHEVLLEVELLEPLMCRELKPHLVLSLVRLLRALKEHFRDHPSFNTHRVHEPDQSLLEYRVRLAEYTRCLAILFSVCVRACLGFKFYRHLHQRLCLFEQFILSHPKSLQISSDEAKRCCLAIPQEGLDLSHPLFSGSKLGNISEDLRLLAAVGHISRIHQKAFAYIYGVTVDEASTAVRVPGMAHVLNLRGTGHFNPIVLSIPAFGSMSLNNIAPTITAFKRMVQDGSIHGLTVGTHEEPVPARSAKRNEYTILEMYISKLSRFKVWRPMSQKGFVVSYQARLGPERRRCLILDCSGSRG